MICTGKWVYCVGEDKILYVFDAKTAELEETVHLDIGAEALQVVHHPNRNLLAIVLLDGSIKLLSAKL